MKKYPNVVKCLLCQEVLVSNHRHDFKQCGCPNKTFVDGGYEYLRCGGKEMRLVEILRLIAVRKG